MQRLANIDFDYYARWYLDRERREKGRWPTPSTPARRARRMKWFHGGKMVPWFEREASWSICRLTRVEELESLLVLSSWWTQAAGLVVAGEARTLINAAKRANRVYFCPRSSGEEHSLKVRASIVRHARLGHFFPRLSPLALPRMLQYRERHLTDLELSGDNRVVLRSLEASEQREANEMKHSQTRYYLHDGFGRLLSLMALIQSGEVLFKPVEAIVAERSSQLMRLAA